MRIKKASTFYGNLLDNVVVSDYNVIDQKLLLCCCGSVFKMFYTQGKNERHVERLDKTGEERTANTGEPAFEQWRKNKAYRIIA